MSKWVAMNQAKLADKSRMQEFVRRIVRRITTPRERTTSPYSHQVPMVRPTDARSHLSCCIVMRVRVCVDHSFQLVRGINSRSLDMHVITLGRRLEVQLDVHLRTSMLAQTESSYLQGHTRRYI